jgi:two-component system, NarL family, sensor kinase
MTSVSAPPEVGEEPAPWRVLADGRSRRPRREPPSFRRTATLFALGSLVALAGIAVVGSAVAQRAAEEEALRDAREYTDLLAMNVLEPALLDPALPVDGLFSGSAPALDRLDRVVRSQMMDRAVRIKLWTPQGRIVYSDVGKLIGRSFQLDPEELGVLTTRTTSAEVSEVSRPENEFEKGSGPLLEVYRPVRLRDGTSLLFELYLPHRVIDQRGSDVWRAFAPITLSAVALLQLCQVPLAWGLVRRLRAAATEREALLRKAIQAAEDERRRIAADLHDGIVQGLAGASFTIAGALTTVERAGLTATAAELRQAADGVRDSIRGLRTTLVEVYPQTMRPEGLPAALRDLAAPLLARGLEVHMVLPEPAGATSRGGILTGEAPHLGLSPTAEALIFRVAQEGLRNVAQHSAAARARLELRIADGVAVLEIGDDGVGTDPAATVGREGHFGLAILRDLVADADALLLIASAPGQGTRIRLEVAAT